MLKERIFLVCIMIIMAIALILFIPRHKIREAMVVFLFQQVLTWPIGLLVVEMHWIAYPVRLFSYSNKSSFVFEYFVYPAISAIAVTHVPRNRIAKYAYYAVYSTIMTVLEQLIRHYSHLIQYISWSWYWTWLTLFITFLSACSFHKWFFKYEPAAE